MAKDPKSNYYDHGGIEVLDIIRAKLTPEQYEGYLLGNSLKYSCRCNFKGSKERDLEKARNYTKWLYEFIIESSAESVADEWLSNNVVIKTKKVDLTDLHDKDSI